MEPSTDTLLAAAGSDSLHRALEELFLAGARFHPAEAADTVSRLAPPTTAADFYGPLSTLAPNTAAAAAPAAAPAGDFQLLLLLLGALYLWLVAHHLGNIYTLFVQTTSRSAALRPNDQRNGSTYTPFLRLSIALGLLFTGLLGMRLAAPQSFAADVPQVTFSLLTSLSVYGVLLLQNGMLRLAGSITLTQEFTTELLATKRSLLALASILLPPALLCYILTPVGSGSGWLGVILAATGIVLFLFLKATLSLFVSKKVSILHWFLYLCTVEIFPVSLLWLLMARN